MSQLEQAAQASHRRDYKRKRHLLRQILGKDPSAFVVDQPGGKYPGVTHKATGWKYHTDRATAGQIKE